MTDMFMHVSVKVVGKLRVLFDLGNKTQFKQAFKQNHGFHKLNVKIQVTLWMGE